MEKSADNIFILVLIATVGTFVISFAIFYIFTLYLRRVNKHKSELLKKQFEHEKEVFSAIITTQEEERRIIGKELHDEVSSVLYAIKLNLKTNSANNQNIESVDKLITITRNISHLLSPPELELLGFYDSINELCTRLSNPNLKINIDDSSNDIIPNKNYQLSIMLYRIIQELITNTIKHANANEINIIFKNTNTSFYILYKDNGIGINPNIINQSKSLGLKNILSRVEFIKANCNFTTNNGFQFELFLNYEHIK